MCLLYLKRTKLDFFATSEANCYHANIYSSYFLHFPPFRFLCFLGAEVGSTFFFRLVISAVQLPLSLTTKSKVHQSPACTTVTLGGQMWYCRDSSPSWMSWIFLLDRSWDSVLCCSSSATRTKLLKFICNQGAVCRHTSALCPLTAAVASAGLRHQTKPTSY